MQSWQKNKIAIYYFIYLSILYLPLTKKNEQKLTKYNIENAIIDDSK